MGMRNTFNFYDRFAYPTIDTTTLSPEQVSKKLLRSFSDELFLPRENQTSEMLFDILYAGGETDEYVKATERSY